MKKLLSIQVKEFQKKIWDFYRVYGRHTLPWRFAELEKKYKDTAMYPITVSEIMLQQTQVSRVLPKFQEWMNQFPRLETLASASRKDVLRLWQGLGYTRRAKFLHEAAQKIIKNGMPKTVLELENLPGIGHYTARAIATFAWNESHVFVETNIRTVYINHFFKDRVMVTDAEILEVVQQTLDTKKPREWMYALMDYGAYLKSEGKAHNGKAKGFTRQSKFKGSVREVRGAIMKFFTQEELFTVADKKEFEKKFDEKRVGEALIGLLRDGLIQQQRGGYKIKD